MWSELVLRCWALALTLSCLLPGSTSASPQDLSGLSVGHWVELKGKLQSDRSFLASSIELMEPEEEEALLGTVTKIDPEETWLELLDQRVELTSRVSWRKTEVDAVLGQQVKVEGYYRGPRKFSARSISLREGGRDRIVGRVDAIRELEEGTELDVLRYRVVFESGVVLVAEEPLDQYSLIEPRAPARGESEEFKSEFRRRSDENFLPGSIRLADGLMLGLRAEYRRETKRDYDLSGATPEDRIDDGLSLRGVLVWSPTQNFSTRVAGRLGLDIRQDEKDGYSDALPARLTEAYIYWKELFSVPLALQLGRQDYYDQREWLWDENLDAARLHYFYDDWHAQLAAITTLAGSSPREEATERYVAEITHGPPDKMWGAYVIDQRAALAVPDYPVFAGLRAYGEWFPDHNVWGELAAVSGYEGTNDIRGWGFDVGTTWSPSAAKPWYFTAGYAFGSGDADPNDGEDGNFRQTGVQDNNGRWGGVTSFKYYGELLEPELSNMHILTLGVGRRFGRRFSTDLVYHYYMQDVARDRLRDTGLDMRPNGIDRELGSELDLIFGHRSSVGLDTEIVLATFDPGSAFDDANRAYYVKLQFRYRF